MYSDNALEKYNLLGILNGAVCFLYVMPDNHPKLMIIRM